MILSQRRLAESKRFGIVTSFATFNKGLCIDCAIFNISPPLELESEKSVKNIMIFLNDIYLKNILKIVKISLVW